MYITYIYVSACYMFCKGSFKTIGIDKDFLGHCTQSLLLPVLPHASYSHKYIDFHLKNSYSIFTPYSPRKKVAESSSNS